MIKTENPMAFLLDNLDAEDELLPVSKPLRKLPETDQVKILDLNLQDALNIKVAASATNAELSAVKETVNKLELKVKVQE